MTDSVPLLDRVASFVVAPTGPADLHGLLHDCLEDGGIAGLMAALRLYEAVYGDMTYAAELKAPAASVLIAWREQGLSALVQAVKQNPTHTNLTFCVQVLATVAAGGVLPELSFIRDAGLEERVIRAAAAYPSLVDAARDNLAALVMSMPNDDEVAMLGGQLSNLWIPDARRARELFAALSARWLAVSTPTLDEYERLMAERPNDESAFQRFLADTPQLLDPIVVQVWPEPDLFGSRQPDFVVRRADNTYMVVEIECPGKLLVTGGGNLSAEVTHAERQATDYRSYPVRHYADAALHFPGFDEPDCLVVVGLERPLDGTQRAVLRDANRHRHRLRIVGFDWLADRARTVSANMTRNRVKVGRLRVT